MNLLQAKQEIAQQAGINLGQNEAMIGRKIGVALESIDFVVVWNFAVKAFSKSISADHNSASVGSNLIFHPIFCKATIGDDVYPLDYMTLSDFERETANWTTTNDYPTNYSVGGNKIYVGPGLLGSDATIEGKYQRKLTTSDIPYLPGSMVIDRTLMLILKPGTPEHIAAWSGWKEIVKQVRNSYTVTKEYRSHSDMDDQILLNMAYMDSLD